MGQRTMCRLTAIAGLLSVQGCLGRIGANLDLLLAPDAFENALVLPFRAVGNLAAFLARFG